LAKKKPKTHPIWCCACDTEVAASLTNGAKVYPSRSDLMHVPFWICGGCGNFVGTHHRDQNPEKRLRPLGVIATPEIKRVRKMIHRILDPLWRPEGGYPRRLLYATIAKRMGWPEYHTAELRSVEDAQAVFQVVKDIKQHGLADEAETVF
jgi:zinc-finger-containing domain